MESIKQCLVVAILLIAVNMQAQRSTTINGNGEVITKDFQTTGYTEINIGGNYYVTLTEGIEGNITIIAESNLLNHIEVETEGNALHIKTENSINLKPGKGKKIEITIPFKTLEKVALAGSGEITSTKKVVSSSLEVIMAGSGNINLPVETESLTTKIAGSGGIKLTGTANELSAKVAGSGNMEFYELKSNNAEVVIAGSGNINLTCNGNLFAKIAGSGNVKYKGTPTSINTKIAGSGKMKPGL